MLIYLFILIVFAGVISLTQLSFVPKEDHNIRREVGHVKVNETKPPSVIVPAISAVAEVVKAPVEITPDIPLPVPSVMPPSSNTLVRTKPTQTIVLVFPYRDRKVHYNKIMKHLPSITRDDWDLHTILVEQDDNKHFNRAWLLNIGIAQAKERFGGEDTCVVTHDVDMIADSKVDYGWCDRPTQICSELSCFGGSVPYKASGGGVVQASLKHWYKINGFTNLGVGWGGEDDDLHHRFRANNLISAGHLRRPAKGFGKCHCMHDEHHTKRVRHPQGYKQIVSKITRMAKGSDEWKTDGLNSLQYAVSKEIVDRYGTIHLKVRKCVNPPCLHEKVKLSEATSLFGEEVLYRIPDLDWQGYAYGVLSGGPKGQTRRQTLRETWCSNANCLFIVAGAYGDVQTEFELHKDILWLDMPETYSGEDSVLPYKTGVFYDAIVKHMPKIKAVIKTDDDSYILTEELQQVLDKGFDYWGYLHRGAKPIRKPSNKWYVSDKLYSRPTYPLYASGAGYALSRKFLKCAQKHLETLTFMPREDVMTGLLAEACHITPEHSNLVDYNGGVTNGKLIRHRVTSADMKMKTKVTSLPVPKATVRGEVIRVTPTDKQHYMYGYYDKKQVDVSNSRILALQIPFYNKEPTKSDEAKVGWVDEAQKFHQIGVTTSWNLQQGAMLEWVGTNRVVFNTRHSGFWSSSFQAVVYKTTNFRDWEIEKTYNKPVYAWDYANERFATISFSRLHNLRRGYGYTVPLVSLTHCPTDDGIWIVDGSKEELLFSYKDLKDYVLKTGKTDKYTKLKHADTAPSGDKYWWVNHLMWSSDGRYLSFILRATNKLHGHSYQFSALMMADVRAKTLWRVPLLRGSHPFHHSTLLNCESKGSYSIEFRKSVKQLPWQKKQDGHCSRHPYSDIYLTDTYPRPKKSLLVFESGKKQTLGAFLPDGEGPVFTRCDLHPRWSTDGDYVLFDSTHMGKRAIYKVHPQIKTEVEKKCKHILIDWGANIGMHSRFVYESDKYIAKRGSKLEKMYAIFNEKLGNLDQRRQHACVFGVEANKKRCNRLEKLSAAHKSKGWRTEYLCPYAVWSEKTVLKFKDQDGIGDGTASRLVKGGKNTVGVQTISAVENLKKIINKHKPETLVLKMDIEGAEYTVLPQLEREGFLCSNKVSDITLEYHYRFTGHPKDWKIPKTFNCLKKSKIHLIDSEDYVKDGKPLP